MRTKKIPVKLIIFILLLFIIFVLNRHYEWSAWLSEQNNLNFLKQMVQDNFLLAASVYTLVTIAGCVLLALPGISFAVLASVIFGPIAGTLLCSFATTIGAAAAFLAGRFFLKDSIKPMAEKNKHLKKLLFDQSDKKQF